MLVFQFNIGIMPEEDILKNSFKRAGPWSLDTVFWTKCKSVGVERAIVLPQRHI